MGNQIYYLESIRRKYGKVLSGLRDAQEAYKSITVSGEDADNFSETFGKDLIEIKD